jgi:iron complex outermembrane receptor protein
MRDKMKVLSALAIASMAAAAFVSLPAVAQTTTVESGTLEEVVVTAQKREESAQKTPISMNVYSAADITQKGVVNLQALTENDTSLMINRSGGTATLALRGVASTATNEVSNPSVPVGIDNFFTNRWAALDATLFDIQRIEVLRGPQGTLYGRAATGGLVNISSNKPSKDEEASASLELGNYNAINVTGVVNIPLGDRVQLRAAGSARKHDGYRANTLQQSGQAPDATDDEDSKAGRVTLAFQPTDTFNGWVNYQQLSIGGVGFGVQSILFNYSPLRPGQTTPDVDHSLPPLGDPNAFPEYGPQWQRISDKTVKWNLTYTGLPGGVTVNLIGGRQQFIWNHSQNAITNFGFVSPNNDFFPERVFEQNEAPTTQNHELRVASAPDGKLTWQAGLFYFHENNVLYSHGLVVPGFGAATSQELLQFHYNVHTGSKAIYGQGSVHISDTATISAGARYSKDDVSRDGTFALPIFNVPPGPDGIGSFTGSKTTFHLGYENQLSATNLAYAKLDTGYKPGGFEVCSGDYKPETVTTGEVGSKNRSAGDRIQFNAAAFYSKYKDQQVLQLKASCNTGSITTNAGQSTIYGVEADFKALVADIGSVDAAFSYLHARYDQFDISSTTGSTCPKLSKDGLNCDLSGNTLISAPPLTVSLGFEHDWAVRSGVVGFRVEGRYIGKQYFDPFDYADAAQDAYTTYNAYVNYKRGNVSVGVYGRNLANKAYLNSGLEFTPGGSHTYQYSYGAPRVFGLRIEASVK